MITTQITYTLQEPISFGEIKIETLILNAPRLVHKLYTAKLQQAFSMAAIKLQAQLKSDDATQEAAKEAEQDGNSLIFTLQAADMGSDNFYLNFCLCFKDLLLQKNIVQIQGCDKNLHQVMIENMLDDDFEALMSVYVQNFIVPSIFRKK